MVTKRWRSRLTVAGKAAGISVGGFVALCAVVGGASQIWGWFFPATGPDISAIAQSTANESAVATNHAVQCMALYKIGTASERGLLRDCFPIRRDFSLPVTPKIFITPPLPLTTTPDTRQSTDTVHLFTVFLGTLERDYAGSVPRQAYYAVPVSVANGGPFGVGLPQRVGGPPAGVSVPTRYTTMVAVADKKTGSGGAAVANDVAGFFTVFLTRGNAGELARYITPQAQIGPLAAYSRVELTRLAADAAVPDSPHEGTTRHVLAEVTAFSEQDVAWPMTYPLTVTYTGGSWVVARMDYMPEVDLDEEPPQITGTEERATTSVGPTVSGSK